MKKLFVFLALAMFLSSCSQYICPTYAKHESKPVTQDAERNG